MTNKTSKYDNNYKNYYHNLIPAFADKIQALQSRKHEFHERRESKVKSG